MNKRIAALLALVLASASLAQDAGFFEGKFPNDITIGGGGTPPDPPPQSGSCTPTWTVQDIGSPPVAGTCSLSQGRMTLTGTGTINNESDSGIFATQSKSGDVRLKAQVNQPSGGMTYPQCGLTIRKSSAADEAYGYVFVGAPGYGDVARFRYKLNGGVGEFDVLLGASTPFPSNGWLAIDLVGSTVTGYWSADDVTYAPIGSADITMATHLDGAAGTSGEDPTPVHCNMSEPQFTTSAPSAGQFNFVPSSTSGGSASAQSINEDAPVDPVVCVGRSGGTSGAVSVQITRTGGTAISGTDFTNVFPSTQNWADGDGTPKCLTVPVADRAGVQTSRTIVMGLANASGGTVGTSQTTHTITILDTDGTGGGGLAQMWRPGVYFAPGATFPWPGNMSEFLSIIANEVCPNSYWQGLQLHVYPGWLSQGNNGLAPDYNVSGSQGGWGFYAVHQMLDALANCPSGRKYLVLQSVTGGESLAPCDAREVYPNYILPFPSCPAGVGSDGTPGTGGDVYPIFEFTSFNAHYPDYSDADVQASVTKVMQDYCAEFKDDPSFYGFNMNYTPSYGADVYFAGKSDEWNSFFRQLLIDARTACPTQMLRLWADWANPDTYLQTLIQDGDVYDWTMNTNDTIPGTQSDGDFFYTGQLGGVDYRAVGGEPFVARWSEIEGLDQCGHPAIGNNTPNQLYDALRFDQGPDPAQPSLTVKALYPQIIGVWESFCPSGYNLIAWKNFLNSLGGATVMNGANSTLRTPESVRTTVCAYARGCQ